MVAAKSLQSCPTLCDPIDGSQLGSTIPGILQARTLEWVAISFSNAWKWKVKVKSLSRVRLLATPWTAAYQAPPPMGFSRQEYWSGVPLPSPQRSRTISRTISKYWLSAHYGLGTHYALDNTRERGGPALPSWGWQLTGHPIRVQRGRCEDVASLGLSCTWSTGIV